MTAPTSSPPDEGKSEPNNRDDAGARAYRDALGEFATGVTVTTCRGVNGAVEGMTVNSFCSISLEPRLICWSIDHNCILKPDFVSAEHFAVNILSADQGDLCDRFAVLYDRKPLKETEYVCVDEGAPYLTAAATVFNCRKVREISLGDHLMLVGEVLSYHSSPIKPLLFHRGRIFTDGAVD